MPRPAAAPVAIPGSPDLPPVAPAETAKAEPAPLPAPVASVDPHAIKQPVLTDEGWVCPS
jgi:hypothetical protein